MTEIDAYVNGDSGYLVLCCGGCGGHISGIDAGDDLAGLNAAARAHACGAGGAG